MGMGLVLNVGLQSSAYNKRITEKKVRNRIPTFGKRNTYDT